MKILVIEDEPKVASFVKRGMEELSYSVELAYDGFMGEKLALSRSYDIILLDIIIPAKNGIELCKAIKLHKPEVPILMLTASAFYPKACFNSLTMSSMCSMPIERRT